jgi:CheY-like chemotaxis protein
MKILVVDDNQELAEVIRGVLEDEGLEVISAKDGIDGYDAYPMVKTIYISGNIAAFRPSIEREKKRYPVSFFEKPFPLMSLTRLVTNPQLIL